MTTNNNADDELHDLQNRASALHAERSKLVIEQVELQPQVSNKNVRDNRGRRLGSEQFWEMRHQMVMRLNAIQSRLTEIRSELHDVSVKQDQLKKHRKTNVPSRAKTLVRRLVAIVDRIGGTNLTDAEADILDEAASFVSETDEE